MSDPIMAAHLMNPEWTAATAPAAGTVADPTPVDWPVPALRLHVLDEHLCPVTDAGAVALPGPM